MPFKNPDDFREHYQRRSKAVKDWRTRTKNKILKSMGGCCQICGYSKCPQALELHHIDPKKKEFPISRIYARPTNPSNYFDELRKCVLLCSNCHREIHAGLVELPEEYARFDEKVFSVPDICRTEPKKNPRRKSRGSKLADLPGLEPGTYVLTGRRSTG